VSHRGVWITGFAQRRRRVIAGAAMVLALACHRSNHLPAVVVVPFESPGLPRLASDLSRDIAQRMAAVSSGRYTLIATASAPRAHFDLKAIGASAAADWVVGGRITGAGSQIEIECDLVRVSDGAHVSTMRFDRRSSTDLAELESKAAKKIAAHFSRRIASVE